MRVVAAVAVAVVLVAASFGGFGVESLAASAKPVVASLDLSHGDLYENIEVVNGKLVLSGGSDGSSLPSGSFAANPTARCASAVVDPVSLAISEQRTAACVDPRLYGERVLPVNVVRNGTRRGSTVRIAHLTTSGFAVGPVVMRYSEASDTDAEWAYGPGSLWIYDPSTTRGSELLRISGRTGAVLQTVRMPWVDRPLLAADDDGLWLAPAINSGFRRPAATGVYHVAPGATRATLVARIPFTALWLLAEGHSVWVAVNGIGKPSPLWRFDDTAGHITRTVLARRLVVNGAFETGGAPRSFGGNATDGIWTVLPQGSQLRQRVVRIDPLTGASTTVASVLPGYVMPYEQPPIAVLRGATFFLDPPATSNTYPYKPQGWSALYRVTPK